MNITTEQLKKILDDHALWINNPEKGRRVDLSRVDLCGADLNGAYLSRADLSRVDLSGANLSGAYLYGADLSRANLYGADLSGAYLCGAKFTVELKDAVNLHAVIYESCQFPFLALNPSFLEFVQSHG